MLMSPMVNPWAPATKLKSTAELCDLYLDVCRSFLWARKVFVRFEVETLSAMNQQLVIILLLWSTGPPVTLIYVFTFGINRRASNTLENGYKIKYIFLLGNVLGLRSGIILTA